MPTSSRYWRGLPALGPFAGSARAASNRRHRTSRTRRQAVSEARDVGAYPGRQVEKISHVDQAAIQDLIHSAARVTVHEERRNAHRFSEKIERVSEDELVRFRVG